MQIARGISGVGVVDREIDLFEGQYAVPNGVSYNSYVITDEKIAVIDTVGEGFGEEWLGNIASVIGDAEVDYLIVQHMEPDHSASITDFVRRYPEATVVASAKAFTMMNNFFGADAVRKTLTVAEGSTLSLGRHTLTFVAAPMVHWPEVIVTYDSETGALFSADAFGKFGAPDTDEPWADEARRYYIGIVGKYGAQVQSLLKKTASLDIRMILPLHGPVLTENLGYYLGLYDTWSCRRAEEEGVVIAYASIYGNTAEAAKLLARELEVRGETVKLYDLARCDIHAAIADAFRYDRLVLASSTYNGDVFPPMHAYIHGLTERGFCKRTVAFIENGSWAPMATKVMKEMLEGSKELTLTAAGVKLLSAVKESTHLEIAALADELCRR